MSNSSDIDPFGTFACLDAAYSVRTAIAACVTFQGWGASEPLSSFTAAVDDPLDYEAGAFYKRELPVLLEGLRRVTTPLAAILVDGYVWLDGQGKPGMGARLFQALDEAVPVIGIAKTAYRGDDWSIRILRGCSQKPLYVTAAGMIPENAAEGVRGMYGASRIPAMLRLADSLARKAAQTGDLSHANIVIPKGQA